MPTKLPEPARSERIPLAAAGAARESAPVSMGRFDAAYYEQFYENRTSCVSDLEAIRRLAGFVAAYLAHLDVPVRSILDIGCGVGHWRTAAAECWPKARYFGVEHSDYLCERFGWTPGSVVDFDAAKVRRDGVFDLVVCQGVLQYLDDRAAARAIANLRRWARGALYLEALTARDWRENCDRARTDGDVHLRSADWYRRRLARGFRACGGGVFLARDAGVTLFELEGCG